MLLKFFAIFLIILAGVGIGFLLSYDRWKIEQLLKEFDAPIIPIKRGK